MHTAKATKAQFIRSKKVISATKLFLIIIIVPNEPMFVLGFLITATTQTFKEIYILLIRLCV